VTVQLEGRGAVVTGGGRGIGAAIAAALADAGAGVVVAARTSAEVEGAAAALRSVGGRAWAMVCDVTRPEEVDELARGAADRLGHVDVLVNNAGFAHSAPLPRIELDDWNRLFAVNATGTFLCTKALLPGMLERGWGRIVNVASISGLQGAKYISAYAASKHAVIGFTRSVAAEVAGRGVTVNAVCPGYVDTDLTRRSIERIVERTGLPADRARRALEERNPQGRLIRPEEVAAVVLSLCSEAAGDRNGEAVVVDGSAPAFSGAAEAAPPSAAARGRS
jgi:NAD(P)-dependent dehydrogenase (short-subunit alcohol dehydrogenase family)